MNARVATGATAHCPAVPGGGTGRYTDGLEQRVCGGQVNHPVNPYLGGCQPRPLDGHQVAGGYMQVGRGLLGDEHALAGTDQQPELARKVSSIVASQPQHYTGTGGLYRATRLRLQTLHAGKPDRLLTADARGLGNRQGDIGK
ncbi:hypothetical protein [Pseudomonas sp. BIC9C]|uniref:hypothetical protein n=1 Tax=Pseudomonas sp. BIC9C TaxID=3078458 RepID=UPI002AD333E3|nr:hypothetical protein [Pseudomonas sp. BIC9C]